MPNEPRYPDIEIYREVCISCGACEHSCPTDVIRIGSDQFPFAAYAEDCQACFLCQWDCPVGAIKISVSRWYDIEKGSGTGGK